ncbi:MAG: anthranilate synthase component II [Culicoidibacterales bacterium]
MIVMIDNYDSFTYNLVDYLQQLGAEVRVFRHDAISVEAVKALDPILIVLSPGPKSPSQAGICLKLIEQCAKSIPILGVCLGHQAIGQAFGAHIVRAPIPVHGKISQIKTVQMGMFYNLPAHFNVARYHSLMIAQDTLPAEFRILARTNDGIIMALEHMYYPLQAVQFHPESIATDYGLVILANAYEKAKLYRGGHVWSSLNAHMSKCDQNNYSNY